MCVGVGGGGAHVCIGRPHGVTCAACVRACVQVLRDKEASLAEIRSQSSKAQAYAKWLAYQEALEQRSAGGAGAAAGGCGGARP
jgi:hypothetical protein